MKFFFTISSFVLYISVFSQFAPEIKSSSQALKVQDTKLMVVLYGDSIYDTSVRKAVEAYWKLTNYNFCTIDELSKFIHQDYFSFLMLTDLKVVGEKDRVKAMALTRGGFSDDQFHINHVLAYIAIDNLGLETEFEDFNHRVIPMVRQIHNMLVWISNQDISESRQETMNEILKEHYNSKSHTLEKKLLLVDIRYTMGKIVSTAEFRELYPYRVDFVDMEKIQKAIEKRDKDKAYLISASNVYTYNMIMDCASGDLIYVDRKEKDPVYGELDRTFNDEDIKLLATTIKESIKRNAKKKKKKKE